MQKSSFLFMIFLTLVFNCTHADLITDICSKTLNPTYCLQYLKQLYRPGESLLDLAKSTVDSGSKLLFFVYDDIHVREIESNDPVLNKIYHKCGVQYTTANNALLKGKFALGFGNYKRLNSLAAVALREAQNCGLSFRGGGVSEPADFKRLNEQGRDTCSVVLVVANLLLSGKS